MLRSEVVQTLLDAMGGQSYLEIGVHKGDTFELIKASRKVAVDPRFAYKTPPSSSNIEYCQVSSDKYFDKCTEIFNLIYLDGLHTFEQTLRDFANAISRISENGVILIDDVIPSSFEASLKDIAMSRAVGRALKQPNKDWMGDVYRLVFFIETFFLDFSYATVAENHGQLVVWRQRRNSSALNDRSVESVARASFESVILEASSFNRMPLANIVNLISDSFVRPDTAGVEPALS